MGKTPPQMVTRGMMMNMGVVICGMRGVGGVWVGCGVSERVGEKQEKHKTIPLPSTHPSPNQTQTHRSHNVGPHARAVHDPLPERQLVLEQGAVLGRQHDLKVALAPARPLLETVAQLFGGFAHRQVLIHVAALPLPLLHLHAQREIFGKRVFGRKARLPERSGAHQEVGAGTRDEAVCVVACGVLCCGVEMSKKSRAHFFSIPLSLSPPPKRTRLRVLPELHVAVVEDVGVRVQVVEALCVGVVGCVSVGGCFFVFFTINSPKPSSPFSYLRRQHHAHIIPPRQTGAAS